MCKYPNPGLVAIHYIDPPIIQSPFVEQPHLDDHTAPIEGVMTPPYDNFIIQAVRVRVVRSSLGVDLDVNRGARVACDEPRAGQTGAALVFIYSWGCLNCEDW